jgi:hypothetical protein
MLKGLFAGFTPAVKDTLVGAAGVVPGLRRDCGQPSLKAPPLPKGITFL